MQGEEPWGGKSKGATTGREGSEEPKKEKFLEKCGKDVGPDTQQGKKKRETSKGKSGGKTSVRGKRGVYDSKKFP